MRTTLSNGRVVKLQFRHTWFKHPEIHERQVAMDADGFPKIVWIKAETMCRLVSADVQSGIPDTEVDTIDPGFARCATADTYLKETARRVSLYHMLGLNPALPLHHEDQTALTLPVEDVGRVLALYYGRKRGQSPSRINPTA